MTTTNITEIQAAILQAKGLKATPPYQTSSSWPKANIRRRQLAPSIARHRNAMLSREFVCEQNVTGTPRNGDRKHPVRIQAQKQGNKSESFIKSTSYLSDTSCLNRAAR